MTIGDVPDSGLIPCDGGCGKRVHPDLRMCGECQFKDHDLRADIRCIALVLNELVNNGARVCTHAERMEAWKPATEALERLKARYGIPAGRGDTREETIEDRFGAVVKAFT